jgi:CheY-like chemotaxis protein
MDVQMPVMDGIDAARLIRSREVESGRPRTPIIALTANAMAHQVDDYAAASMDGHVAKPIDARALFEALARFAPTEGGDLAPWNAAPKLANAV